MVTGFELETAPLSDDEKKLVPIIIDGLLAHQGADKAIHGAAICKAVTAKYGKLTEPRLRKITNFLRSAKIIPVIATSKGYYVSYNAEVIKKQIESLEQRRDAINTAIDGLIKWLPDSNQKPIV